MTVVEVLTREELDKAMEGYKYAVIDFRALDWCRPCQLFEPQFQAAAEMLDNHNVAFVTVDVDNAQSDWLEAWAVKSVPTVLFVTPFSTHPLASRTAEALQREILDKLE